MKEIKKFFYLSRLNNVNFEIKIFFLIIINFFNTILEFIGLASIIPFLGKITNTENKLFGLDDIIQSIGRYFNIGEINSYLFFILSCFLLRNLISIFAVYLSTKFVHEFTINISNIYFKKKVNLPFLDFSLQGSNYFVRNLRDVISNYRAYNLAFILFFSEILIVASIITLLILVDAKSSIIVLTILIIIMLFFLPYLKKRVEKWANIRNQSTANINKILITTFNTIREIKIFQKELIFLNFFKKSNFNFSNVLRKYDYSVIVIRNYIEIAVLLLIMFLTLIFFNLKNEDSLINTLALYLIVFIRIYPSVNRCISYYLGIKNNQVAVNTLYDEFKYLKKFNKKENTNNKFIFNKNINVKINYHKFPHMSEKILKNVKFNINKNSLVGLTGPNGSGKSTLSNFILGLIKPTSGSVKLDQKFDISEIHKSFNNIISFVPQNTFLFEGTIYQNIIFENEFSKIDKDTEKKVEKIINSSKFFSFINKRPKKLHSLVKENGINFSGGQKQTISIARALYSNPKILIFDEPTNNLDKNKLKIFLDLIITLKINHTILTITHDKNLLNICDKVINLKS